MIVFKQQSKEWQHKLHHPQQVVQHRVLREGMYSVQQRSILIQTMRIFFADAFFPISFSLLVVLLLLQLQVQRLVRLPLRLRPLALPVELQLLQLPLR